jgi:hypothetical protein
VTTLVAMTYYRHAEYVERAVRSVLAQTEHDLQLLVLGDGEAPPLRHIRDARLEVHTLAANHGTYFGHQVMVMASPHAWYAPVDADDWVEPEHLERMAALGSDAVAPGAVWFHRGGRARVWAGRPGHPALYHVGRFATARLRGVGGYDPMERVGQDTLLLRMLRQSGGLTRWAPPDPTYHRVRRPGTLTTAPETGLGSPERRAARRRNREVYQATAALGTAEAICRYRLARIRPDVLEALAEEVELLQLRLGLAVAA